MQTMKAWSSFTANDIDNDGELDIAEMNMLLWLTEDCKPSPATVMREIKIMDANNSSSIDRIEWVSYLTAPKEFENQLGNANYYDFEMREIFEKLDKDNTGLVSME